MTAQTQAVEAAEREKFEAWMTAKGYSAAAHFRLESDPHSFKVQPIKYYSPYVEHDWAIWKARAELTGAQPAIVPVSVTPDDALVLVDKIISKLEGRKQVLNLDFDEELVNEIRLEMAETILEALAKVRATPTEQGDAKDSEAVPVQAEPPTDTLLAELRHLAWKEGAAKTVRAIDVIIGTPQERLAARMINLNPPGDHHG